MGWTSQALPSACTFRSLAPGLLGTNEWMNSWTNDATFQKLGNRKIWWTENISKIIYIFMTFSKHVSICLLRFAWKFQFSKVSVQFSCSVVSDSLWPMNCSTPGLPVHHQLPEFTQTHVHLVGDAIPPSHPLSSPSPPAPNPSQHQGLFQWVNSSHEVAKVLEFQC